MPNYLIERDIPGAGLLSAAELKAIAQRSCNVLRDMGPDIQWLESHVTDDRVYCLYRAPNEEMIRQHAERGGFPVSSIREIVTRIDPATAD